MKRNPVRIRLYAPGLSPRQWIRLLKTAVRIRILIRRHGFDAVADTLEQAGAETGVTVRGYGR